MNWRLETFKLQVWRVSRSRHCDCLQNWDTNVFALCALRFLYLACQLQDSFCKYAILQISRCAISRHWQFSFSCRKQRQVRVSRNSLFSHRILLYGKASVVKRQEIFFLLERDFLFLYSNRRPTHDAKKKPTSSRRLQEKCHQKPVWWEKLLVSY